MAGVYTANFQLDQENIYPAPLLIGLSPSGSAVNKPPLSEPVNSFPADCVPASDRANLAGRCNSPPIDGLFYGP